MHPLPKRLALAALAVMCGASSHAAIKPFSFEGFYLGMPREQADALRADFPWEEEELQLAVQLNILVKEFPAVQYGKPTTVRVELDSAGKVVVAISFKFASRSESECLADSTATFAQLKAAYGPIVTLLAEQPVKWLQWRTSSGFDVSWMQFCAGGIPGHRVSFSLKG